MGALRSALGAYPTTPIKDHRKKKKIKRINKKMAKGRGGVYLSNGWLVSQSISNRLARMRRGEGWL